MTTTKIKKAAPVINFHCRTCLGDRSPGDFATYYKGKAMCVYCKAKIKTRTGNK